MGLVNKFCPDCGKQLRDKRSKRCWDCAAKIRQTRPRQCKSCGAPPPDARGFRGARGMCRTCAMKAFGKEKIASSTCYVTLHCEWCGKEYTDLASQIKTRTFCCVPCFNQWTSANKSGKNSHMWKGGCIQYYGPNWRKQRKEARKRAGFKCEYCAKDEDINGKALDVHHIKPFKDFGYIPDENDFYKQANDLGNLVALCMICHRNIEWNNIIITSRLDLPPVPIDIGLKLC